MDSYVCFNRRDFECLDDLSERKQPVGRILEDDAKFSFSVLKKVLYKDKNIDPFLRGVLIREWKKIFN